MMYDLEVKFDNFNEFGNSKIKIIYGTKAFELNTDSNSKVLKYKKIIYFITKSEE